MTDNHRLTRPATAPDGDECEICDGRGHDFFTNCADCGGTGRLKSFIAKPTEPAAPAPDKAPADTSGLEFDEDDIAEAISDSLDMDWQPRDGARAVMAMLEEQGILTALRAQPGDLDWVTLRRANIVPGYRHWAARQESDTCAVDLTTEEVEDLIESIAALANPAPAGQSRVLTFDQVVPTGQAERVGGGVVEALEPVMHWYQSDEHPPRPLADIVKDVVADLQADRAFVLNPPKHRFWMAGEPDCPRDIKAGNGELHTLRCKVCGQDNPRDSYCRAALSLPDARQSEGELERLREALKQIASCETHHPNDVVSIARAALNQEVEGK